MVRLADGAEHQMQRWGHQQIEQAAADEKDDPRQVFGVSAFGTDLGLRIMEGLGLVAVT